MDPIVRRQLVAVLHELTTNGWSQKSQVDAVLDKLHELVELARTRDPFAVYDAQSVLNFVFDVLTRDAIDPGLAHRFLGKLVRKPDAHTLSEALGDVYSFVLEGPRVEFPANTAAEAGVSLVPWRRFCRWYADRYGCVEEEDDTESLWDAMCAGLVRDPHGELSLDNRNHTIWFSDGRMLYATCGSADENGSLDASCAYEALALDWSGQWEVTETRPVEVARTRCVLLSCTLECRSRGQKGVRIPTAIEGWRSLLFTPLWSSADAPWVGGSTCDPTTGTLRLVEAVHGPLALAPTDVSVAAVGTLEISGSGSRLKDCGSQVLDRGFQRVTDASKALPG